MSAIADVLDALKSVILLTDRVASLGKEVERIATDLRGIDRRLIGVEAKLDLLTQAAFAGRGMAAPSPPQIENKGRG